MTNIKRNLSILRYAIILLVAVILISPTWYWVSPDSLRFAGPAVDIVEKYGGMSTLTMGQKIGGYMATLLPNLILAIALVHLLKIVKRLSAGNWFEEENEQDWTYIGYALLAYIGAEVLHRTLLVIAVTINNPVGERVLHVEIDSGDLKAVVPALLALVISYMVSIARKQRDELNEIV